MAIPTIPGQGADNSGTTAAVTYVLPSHQADDILLCVVETNLTTGLTTATSGWAHITTSPRAQGSNVTCVNVFWKRATSGAETNPVIDATSDHQVGFAFAVRGCVTSGNPWDFTPVGSGNASGSGMSATGGTTTVANTLVIIASGNQTDTATDNYTTLANTTLSDEAILNQSFTASGNGGGVMVATGTLAAAGATGTTTATITTAGGTANLVFALVGASGGTPATVSPPAATATAAAGVPDLAAKATVAAALAATTALAPVPVVAAKATVSPPVATATSDGLAPTLTAKATVSPPVATASAQALAPVVTAPYTATGVPVATATGTALPPAVGGASSVSPPAATGSAAALAPTLTARATVTPPVATATAAALTPTVKSAANVAAVTATATAAAAVPAVGGAATVSAPTATAVGQGLTPVVTGGSGPVSATVNAPTAVATGAALAPSVTGRAAVTAPIATATAAALVAGLTARATVQGEVAVLVAVALPPVVSAVVEAPPTWHFEPPTHEEPMRVSALMTGDGDFGALPYYRLTHALSVVRVDGTFVSIQTPAAEVIQNSGGVEGVDFFRGGHIYPDIPAETAAELVAAGYTVT